MYRVGLLTCFFAVMLAGCGDEFVAACSTNAECGAEGICDLAAGACRYTPGSCATAAECAAGDVCEGASAEARGVCVTPTPPCMGDADCEAGEACDVASGMCAPRGCERDAECTVAGQRCLPGPELVSKQCRAPSSCVEAADPDAYCAQQMSDATCNVESKLCEVPAPLTEFRYVMIQDVSLGDACGARSAEGLAEPGADIMWAFLDDNTGALAGVGRLVMFVEGVSSGDPNSYRQAARVFTGQEPALDVNACPEDTFNGNFTSDTVVSLGCGGALFLDFVGAGGETVLVEDGYALSVGEYASVCAPGGAGSDEDRYEFYLCETAPGASPDNASCTTKLTGSAASGILAPISISIAE